MHQFKSMLDKSRWTLGFMGLFIVLAAPGCSDTPAGTPGRESVSVPRKGEGEAGGRSGAISVEAKKGATRPAGKAR